MKDLEVRKSNALVEASFRLSLAEHRIILACIAQVQDGEPLTDEKMYVIDVMDVAERSGIPRQDAYRDLKAAADRLYDRSMTVPYAPDGGRPRRRRFRWVQEDIQYEDGEGCITIRFSKAIVPYLRELAGRYTVYALQDVAQMTSAYGIRLYELLMQWRKRGWRQVEVDWLRTAFQLDDKYPAYKDLRRWVIEPAVKQVNAHSPVQVTWRPIKTKRRVTHLMFEFNAKKPAKTKAQTPKPPADKPQDDAHDWYGIKRATLEERMQPGEGYEACALRLLDERRAT